jgi:isopentenyl-diphosphate Delta-isomerase
MSIKDRKKDHVELTASGRAAYQKTAGFDRYDFNHDALPEVNLKDVSTSASLLGREFSFPLFLSSMTGGYEGAQQINAMIAETCEKLNLPFGVGSQRVMIENPEEAKSFGVVRDIAPTAFIASNIGGAQLIGNLSDDHLKIITETIQADAIIVHLNPLQELIQPEGDRNFQGIEKGITHLVTNCDLPVIVKETGAGISAEVASRLLSVGVQVIDVSGAGGTSWSKVERLRADPETQGDFFDNWGIPTVDCVEQIIPLRNTFRFGLIASGGIRSAADIVKSLALGANFAATAQPIIKKLKEEGQSGLEKMLNQWQKDMAIILTLLGCRTIRQLSTEHLRKREIN